MRTTIFVLLMLSTLSPRATGAAERQVAGLQPLLRVHSQVLTAVDLPPLDNFVTEQRDVFISKGGFSQSVYILGNDEKYTPSITRGTVTQADLRALNRVLGAGRAGTRGDCQLNGVLGGGYYRFVWYGRGARINEFTIHLTKDALPALPLCPDGDDLIQALFQFEGRLRGRPDTEVLVP